MAKGSGGTRASSSNADTKQRQLEIILKSNPVNDDYHTWIRTKEDIKSFNEVYDEWKSDGAYSMTPDFSASEMERAMRTGEITVYSSYNIKDGVFVTPSRMEAESYAGSSKVSSMRVKVSDIAWIDSLQGQYAPIKSKRK